MGTRKKCDMDCLNCAFDKCLDEMTREEKRKAMHGQKAEKTSVPKTPEKESKAAYNARYYQENKERLREKERQRRQEGRKMEEAKKAAEEKQEIAKAAAAEVTAEAAAEEAEGKNSPKRPQGEATPMRKGFCLMGYQAAAVRELIEKTIFPSSGTSRRSRIWNGWQPSARYGKRRGTRMDIEKEYCEMFDDLRKNRVRVGFYKYGSAAENFGKGYMQAIPTLERCLEKYKETGNTEYLCDLANYAMFEFMYPQHPKGHFRATDSEESAGIVGLSVREAENWK